VCLLCSIVVCSYCSSIAFLCVNCVYFVLCLLLLSHGDKQRFIYVDKCCAVVLKLLVYTLIIEVMTVSASAIQCYRCTSSQPGCGKELSIRVQRWHTCEGTGVYGGENFCVKIIEKINCTSSFLWCVEHYDSTL